MRYCGSEFLKDDEGTVFSKLHRGNLVVINSELSIELHSIKYSFQYMPHVLNSEGNWKPGSYNCFISRLLSFHNREIGFVAYDPIVVFNLALL